jgi:hypothetical protein
VADRGAWTPGTLAEVKSPPPNQNARAVILARLAPIATPGSSLCGRRDFRTCRKMQCKYCYYDAVLVKKHDTWGERDRVASDNRCEKFPQRVIRRQPS